MENCPELSGSHIVVGSEEEVIRAIREVESLPHRKVSHRNTPHFLNAADESCVIVSLCIFLVKAMVRIPPAAVEVHDNPHSRHQHRRICQLE
jgi:hypothetical protein